MNEGNYTIIRIISHDSIPDREGERIETDASRMLGISPGSVRTGTLYYFSAAFAPGMVEWFAEKVLADGFTLVASTLRESGACGKDAGSGGCGNDAGYGGAGGGNDIAGTGGVFGRDGSFLLSEARPGLFDHEGAAAQAMFEDFTSLPRDFNNKKVFSRKIFYFANQLSANSMQKIANVLLGGEHNVFTFFEAGAAVNISFPPVHVRFSPGKIPEIFDILGPEERLDERARHAGLDFSPAAIRLARKYFATASTAKKRGLNGIAANPSFLEMKIIERAKNLDFTGATLSAGIEFFGPDGFRLKTIGSIFGDYIKRSCDLAATKIDRGAVEIRKAVARKGLYAGGTRTREGGPGIWAGDVIYIAGALTYFDGIEGNSEAGGKKSDGKTFRERPDDPRLRHALDAFIKRAQLQNHLRSFLKVERGGLAEALCLLAETSPGIFFDVSRIASPHENITAIEKMLSESPARVLLAVPKECAAEIAADARDFGISLSDAGTFTETGAIEISSGLTRVCCLDLEFLARCAVKRNIRIDLPPEDCSPEPVFHPGDIALFVQKLLTSVSREEKIQNRLAAKFLAGTKRGGDVSISPGDLAVRLTPAASAWPDAIIRHGACAIMAADFVLRAAVAAGAPLPASSDYRRKPFEFSIAVITPEIGYNGPDANALEQIGKIAFDCEALSEYASFFGIPFKNVFEVPGEPVFGETGGDILPVFIINADTETARPGYYISPSFRAPGDLIFTIGRSIGSLSGSAAFRVSNIKSFSGLRPDFEELLILYMKVSSAAEAGLFKSCAPVGPGGAFAAIVKAAVSSGLGAVIDPGIHSDDLPRALFSEDGPGFVVSADNASRPKLEAIFGDCLRAFGKVEGFRDTHRPQCISIRSGGKIIASIPSDIILKAMGTKNDQ